MQARDASDFPPRHGGPVQREPHGDVTAL